MQPAALHSGVGARALDDAVRVRRRLRGPGQRGGALHVESS
jgi:hypothetical protein